MKIIEKLRAANVPNPVRDYQILAANFSGPELEIALNARIDRVPLSHILGKRWFWKHEFFVNADVLDPRPDSELLIELALKKPKIENILDLGAGSGALGISLLSERPNSQLVLADISLKALEIAKRNAENILSSKNIAYIQTNWFENIHGRYDVILCNPPYIAQSEMQDLEKELSYEPRIALTDEDDGLTAYRIIAQSLKNYLAKEGIAIFEHGYLQQEKIIKIFENYGFIVQGFQDLSQKNRAVLVELPK